MTDYETMVKLELLLVSIGHDLRKYHTHKLQIMTD